MCKEREKNYDPLNNYFSEDYNPHKIEKIDKKIRDLYIRSEKCKTCKLEYEDKIPECFNDCMFWVHWTGGSRGKGKPVVETKITKNLLTLRLTRAMLLLLYQFGFPCISRTRNYSKGKKAKTEVSDNKAVIHHINGDPYDDRPENINFILECSHKGIHNTTKSMLEKVKKLKEELIKEKHNCKKIDGDMITYFNIKSQEVKKIEDEIKEMLCPPHSEILLLQLLEFKTEGYI